MENHPSHFPFVSAPEVRTEPSLRVVRWALLGMVGIAVLLSLVFFLHQSLRLDEAQSLWQTSRSPLAVLQIVAGDVHVPLYHMLLHFWRLFIADSVTSARLMSLLFFLLIIPATYALGARAYNRRVGLFAAFLMCISPFMNWYGNEIRMYTLFTLLVILNQYCFVQLWKESSPSKQSKYWWGYLLTALFGIYSHYFFFFNLASQAIFFLMRGKLFPKGTFTRLVLVAVCVAVAFAPWVYTVYATGTASNQQPLLEAPTSVNLFSTFAQFIFGFQDDHVNTIFLSLWPIGIIFAFVALRDRRKATPEGLYFLITIIASVSLAFLISATIRPVFVSRYLAFTIPSLYLLLAAHIDSYAARYRSIAKITLAALMFATLIVQVVTTASPVKENYREATNYLNANVTPQDVVVISSPFTIYPVQYYYRASAPLETIPIWDRDAFGAIPPFSAATLPTEVDTISQNHQNLWLLLSYDQGYESTVKEYFDTHYQKLQEIPFSSDLTLYEYKISYTKAFSLH